MSSNGKWDNRIVGHGTKPADQFQAHPQNWRLHPQFQRDVVRGSLDELGWVNVVIENVRTGNLLDGHDRIFQALERNEDVPYIQVDLSEEEEAKALLLLDSSSALARPDRDNLDALLAQVSTEDAALNTLLNSLADDGVRDLLDSLHVEIGGWQEPEEPPEDQGAQIDRASELQEIWAVERGDLWRIGDHRLLCGDSTVREDVERVMDGERALLCVTDPPYGLNHDSTWREEAGISTAGPQLARDIQWDEDADWSEAYRLAGVDVAYVWHATIFNRVVADSLENAGYEVKQQIIWNKSVAAFGRSHYSYKHEPCWYAVRRGQTSKWIGPPNEVTVWDAASPRHIMGGSDEDKQPHATQKPLECMARPIRNHDAPIVYDPFGGSGTTMVAAEQLGRRCMMVEIEPKYCAVILERMQDMGLQPERA